MRKSGFRCLVALVLLTVLSTGGGCTAQIKKASHLKRANRFYSQQKYHEAVIEYLNVLRLDPSNSVALERLGCSFYALQDFPRAFPFLLETVRQNNTNLEARLKLGTIYFAAGQPEEAQKQAEAILACQPSNVDAVVLATLVACSRDNESNTTSNVDATVERLISLKNNFSDPVRYHITLGTIHAKRKRFQEAEQAFKTAVALDTNSAVAHLALGDFYRLKGEPGEAEAQYELAMTLTPTSSVARARVAELKLRNGDVNGARILFEGIHKDTSEYAGACYRLAQIAIAEKDYVKAVKLLQQTLQASPYHFSAFILMQRAKEALGRHDEVSRDYQRVISLFPKAVQLRYELALFHARKADFIPAIAELKECVARAPDWGEATALLAELNLRVGNFDAAIETLTKYLERHPDSAAAYALLGRIYQAKQDPRQALSAYRKVVELAPSSPEGFYLAGMALRQQGRL